MQQLYQENPRVQSTYTRHKNRSFTDSLESYQNGAFKQAQILRQNKRLPRVEFVLHFLQEFSVADIRTYRTKIFRCLRTQKIEAVVSIELTKGQNNQPNNTVHFHILTDDQRSEEELRALFNKACEGRNLVKWKDFRIDYRELSNPDGYFNYFTKFGYNTKVILFQPKTGLCKFTQIGKWFRKSKEVLWKEFKQETFGTSSKKTVTN
jgi:hypothetical protein